MYHGTQRYTLRDHSSRKRKLNYRQTSDDRLKPLLLENPKIPDPVDTVVEAGKVITYMKRIAGEAEEDTEAYCVRILIGNTESLRLNLDAQTFIASEFGLCSISLSDSSPYSIDRILTIRGTLKSLLTAAAFLSYKLSSDMNNVLKSEAFTLKSLNYKIDILVEAEELELDNFASKMSYFDSSMYDCNRHLNHVTLKGDVQYIFNTVYQVTKRFPLKKYVQDTEIRSLPIIRLHDHDRLFKSTETEADLLKSKEELLKFIYTAQHVNKNGS